MTEHVLLLRAVNVGGRNTVVMADLRALLEQLGHTGVRTVLNTGNAVFTSDREDHEVLAGEVEGGLRALGVEVRACVRSPAQLRAAVDAVPGDLPPYVLICVLLAEPASLVDVVGRPFPDVDVRAGEGVLYLGYAEGVGRSKLTASWLERRLGVPTTSRTPATLRKLL